MLNIISIVNDFILLGKLGSICGISTTIKIEIDVLMLLMRVTLFNIVMYNYASLTPYKS